MRLFASMLLVAAILASACSSTTDQDGNTINPVGPSTTTPQTGRLAFSTNANRGWSTIDIYVDDAYIGTLRRYYEAGNGVSCVNDGDARVATTLNVGPHSYTARTNTGGSWSGTHTVSAGSCMEINLTCNSGDCSR